MGEIHLEPLIPNKLEIGSLVSLSGGIEILPSHLLDVFGP